MPMLKALRWLFGLTPKPQKQTPKLKRINYDCPQLGDDLSTPYYPSTNGSHMDYISHSNSDYSSYDTGSDCDCGSSD